MIYEKLLVSLPRTHENWVGKLRRRGDRGENCVCWPEDGWIETSVHKPVPPLYFKNRLITSDSKLFLFRKYTNHLQVLFASVFTKRSWQEHTFWVYIKQGMSGYESVFFCAVLPHGRRRGRAQGWLGCRLWVRSPRVKQSLSHLHSKWQQQRWWCWRPVCGR